MASPRYVKCRVEIVPSTQKSEANKQTDISFTKMDGSAVGALVTLAALAREDDNMTDLAKMILWLALYEVKLASWNVSSDETHENTQ